MARNYVAVKQTNLTVGVSIGATSIVLDDFKDIYGNTLALSDFGDKIYGRINPDGDNIAEDFTASGLSIASDGKATLSGIKTVLAKSPYTETSGLVRAHSSNAIVRISNTPGFYNDFVNKNNNEEILGRLTVPANLPPQLKTYAAPVDDKDMASKKYVDDTAGGTPVSIDRIVIGGNAGETVAAGDWLYFKESDQEWYKTDASVAGTSRGIKIGVAQGAGTDGNAITGGVLIRGKDSNQTGLTAGNKYYLSDTAGAIANSPGTVEVLVGWALSTTEIVIAHNEDLETVTSDEKDALAGTSGTPSSSNKYVTADDVTATPLTANKIPRADANGLLNAWVQNEKVYRSYTAFENVSDDLIKFVNDSGTTKARILEGLNTLATQGVGTTTADEVRIVKIDTDKVVLGYNTGGTFNAVAGTISGGTITFGTPASVSGSLTGSNMHLDMCQVDTDKFCMVATGDGQTPDAEITVATVSGTTITFGAAAGITGNTVSFKRDVTVCQLDTDKILVAVFFNTPTVLMRVGTISGTGVTFNTSGTVAQTQGEMVLVQTGTDKAFMVYEDSNNNDIYYRAYTVSGTTVTSGSAVVVETGTFDKVTAYSPAEDKVVIAYGDTTATPITMKSYTISGTTATLVQTWTDTTATNNLGGLALVGDDLDRVYLVANYDQKITMWGFNINTSDMKFSQQFKQVLDGNHTMNHGQLVLYNTQRFVFGWLDASNNYAYMTGAPDWYEFRGKVDGTVTAGNTAVVYMPSSYADGFSSLALNVDYYIGHDGALTVEHEQTVNGETFSCVKIGRSESATEMILD